MMGSFHIDAGQQQNRAILRRSQRARRKLLIYNDLTFVGPKPPPMKGLIFRARGLFGIKFFTELSTGTHAY
jgi:hypothetical protein